MLAGLVSWRSCPAPAGIVIGVTALDVISVDDIINMFEEVLRSDATLVSPATYAFSRNITVKIGESSPDLTLNIAKNNSAGTFKTNTGSVVNVPVSAYMVQQGTHVDLIKHNIQVAVCHTLASKSHDITWLFR